MRRVHSITDPERKGGGIMKERKIEVKVTFTEGYERRYTEACLKQIAKREAKKGERVA